MAWINRMVWAYVKDQSDMSETNKTSPRAYHWELVHGGFMGREKAV